MSARMRRALAIALIIVLLVCPQRANGARNPEPTHEPAPSRLGAHPSHGSNSKPSLTLPSLPDAGQFLSKFIGKNVRRVWKNRRDAAAEGRAPVGWLDRTFDWLDGRVSEVLNRVPLGRSHYDEETAAREWKETFGDDGSFEASDGGGGATWESTTTQPAGGAEELIVEEPLVVEDPSREGVGRGSELQPQTTKAKEESQPEATKAKEERKPKFKRKGPDPLADKKRKPDFVFTMGGRDEETMDEGEGGQENRNKPREPEYKDAEDSGGRFNNPEFQQHILDTVARAKAKAAARAAAARSSKPGYTREKTGANIGDAVTDLTQKEEARVNKAKEEAERAKSQRADIKPSGATIDVETEIAVLRQDTFDAATALAQRMSDGVGLGRAGGLGGVDGDAEKVPGSDKRRWIIAFCTRWAPPCNLLVREFALLQRDERVKDFALGWVDCTPPSMSTFCAGRFQSRGYPSVVALTGGRLVRFAAVDRERIAGVIAPWAKTVADEIDGWAPNSGEPAPGAPVPPPVKLKKPPEDGTRGARATYESEADAVERTVEARRKREERDRYERLLEEKRRMIERKEAAKSGKIKTKKPAATEEPKSRMSARRRFRMEQDAARTEL